MAKPLGSKANAVVNDGFPLSNALRVITADALDRSRVIYRQASTLPILYILGLVPKASASPAAVLYTGNGGTGTIGNLSDPAVAADVNFLIQLLDFKNWTDTAKSIRDGTSRAQCLANLNLAMSLLGPLENAEMSGSSGALTLLPTAGALIGAPTKELWVVYKLMPIAGILSMLLSLGGNIVPTEASDYELNGRTFSYGGMVATIHKDEEENELFEHNLRQSSLTESEIFAARVEARAKNPNGGQKFVKVWYGIILQCFWLAIVIGACWFTQAGSVIVWWCKAWGWMFFWYLMVALSSLLENFASVPFTKQWTLRISRAPKVTISDDAPYVNSKHIPSHIPKQSQSPPQLPQHLPHEQHSTPHQNDSNDEITEPTLSTQPTLTLLPSPSLGPLKSTYTAYTTATTFEKPPLTTTSTNRPPLLQHTSSLRHDTRILDDLSAGFNTRGRIALENPKTWSCSRTPFYAIISLEGVSSSHALLRVVSKAITVGVFAAGTAIFASAQLVSITVALTVLCLVLGAGVFGRVIAMYMASEMMKSKPVLHRVVKNEGAAAEYLEAIMAVEGLVVECLGHVVVEGRVVGRYSQWGEWSAWAGVLAGPFDLGRLARGG